MPEANAPYNPKDNWAIMPFVSSTHCKLVFCHLN